MSLNDLMSSAYANIGLTVAIGIGIWQIIQYKVQQSFDEKLDPLIELVKDIDRRNSRIEYALYNDGKTGLINKVELLIENQAEIKTDIAVIKAKRGK